MASLPSSHIPCMSVSSSTPSGAALSSKTIVVMNSSAARPASELMVGLPSASEEVAAGLLVERVQPGRGLDALLGGDQRAPDAGRRVGGLAGRSRGYSSQLAGRRREPGLLEEVGAVVHGAVVHHDRQRDERALVGHGLERGLARSRRLSASVTMPRELRDEALLVELRQPHLVGDVDVEAAGARQRVEHELLADVVVRDGDELDLDARGLGELAGVGAVEGVVGRAGLHADRDLARCGEGPADEGQPEGSRRWRRRLPSSRSVRRVQFAGMSSSPVRDRSSVPLRNPLRLVHEARARPGRARSCAPSPPRRARSRRRRGSRTAARPATCAGWRRCRPAAPASAA